MSLEKTTHVRRKSVVEVVEVLKEQQKPLLDQIVEEARPVEDHRPKVRLELVAQRVCCVGTTTLSIENTVIREGDPIPSPKDPRAKGWNQLTITKY